AERSAGWRFVTLVVALRVAREDGLVRVQAGIALGRWIGRRRSAQARRAGADAGRLAGTLLVAEKIGLEHGRRVTAASCALVGGRCRGALGAETAIVGPRVRTDHLAAVIVLAGTHEGCDRNEGGDDGGGAEHVGHSSPTFERMCRVLL